MPINLTHSIDLDWPWLTSMVIGIDFKQASIPPSASFLAISFFFSPFFYYLFFSKFIVFITSMFFWISQLWGACSLCMKQWYYATKRLFILILFFFYFHWILLPILFLFFLLLFYLEIFSFPPLAIRFLKVLITKMKRNIMTMLVISETLF